MVGRLQRSPGKPTCTLQCMGRIIGAIVVILSVQAAMGHEDLEREVKDESTYGYEQLKFDRFDESISAFQRCLELKPKSEVGAYDLACAYSRKGDLDRAAEWFQRAIDWGFDGIKHVETDADMDNFRKDPRYPALMGVLRKKYPMGRQRDTTPGLTRLLDLVVMIRGEVDIAGTPTPTYGAGILFGCDGQRAYLVTANHVVRYGQEARKLQVLLKAKPELWLDATLMPHFDQALDIAVLSIEPLERHGLQFCGLPVECTTLAPEWSRGDNVYPVGYPNAVSWGMPVAPDRVAQVIGHEIAFQSAFIAKGHSGGALISGKGALVGLLRAEEPPYGVAIAIERVLQTLRAWNYPIQLRELPSPGRTDLHLMAEQNAIDAMRRLLENCANPNAADAVGWTPLHAAAKNGSGRAAELLLEKGAEPYVWTFTEDRDQTGQIVYGRDWQTPLHVAAASGSADVVRTLLARGMNPDVRGLKVSKYTRNRLSESPLEIAAKLGHAGIISLLVKAGASVNGDQPDTPLHLATEAGKLESVKALLELGANATPADKRSWSDSPLQIAIKKGHVEIVRALINAKANVNFLLNPDNPLPLNLAMDRKANDIMRLLLDAGARADAGTINVAIKNSDLERLKFLLRMQPNLNEEAPFRDGHRRTPLAAAIELAQLDFVKMLVDAGADVNRAGWSDFSPVFIAMAEQKGGWWYETTSTAEQQEARAQIEEFLITRGARLGKVTDIQDLLWKAVRYGRVSAVKLLIAEGANPNTHRYVGTNLGLAIQHGNVEIVRTLLEAGAELVVGGIVDFVDANRLLTYGIQNNDAPIVRHALRGGANVIDRDLELAVRGGNKDIISLVRSGMDGTLLPEVRR